MVAPEGDLHRVIALNSATWTSAVIVGPSFSGLLYAVHPALAFGTAVRPRRARDVRLRRGAGSAASLSPPDPGQPPDPAPRARRTCGSCGAPRWCSPPSRSICSRCCSAARWPCSRRSPRTASASATSPTASFGRSAGVGAAAMAILLAIRPDQPAGRSEPVRRRRPVRASTIVLGLTRSYAVAFVAIVVLSAADMISVYIRGTLVPLVTPDEKRGRVARRRSACSSGRRTSSARSRAAWPPRRSARRSRW